MVAHTSWVVTAIAGFAFSKIRQFVHKPGMNTRAPLRELEWEFFWFISSFRTKQCANRSRYLRLNLRTSERLGDILSNGNSRLPE